MDHAVPGTARDLFAEHHLHPGATGGAVAARVRERGLAVVGGLDSREAVLAFAARYLRLIPHRDSDPDGLTVIHDTGARSGRPGYAGLGAGELAPHTERSGVPVPPRLMLIACDRPADEGGVCLLTDGRAVHADLVANHPEAAEALSDERAGFFGGQDGAFAAVFHHTTGQRISVRLRLDGLVRWNPAAAPHIRVLTKVIARHQRYLRLDAGDAYLIDNSRWLHARTAFSGPRRLYRALGDPRFTIPDGFTPGTTAGPPEPDR